jgi:tetratricopeptide (TPR) repeat protein
MEEGIAELVPALRVLHEEGDTATALRLVEAIADLAEGEAGLRTAAALQEVGERLPAEAAAAAFSCLGAARRCYAAEGVDLGVGACDVLAAERFAAGGAEERAAELFAQGVALLDADLDPGFAGRAHHNHGILLHRLGRHEEALHAHDHGLAAYRRTGRAVPAADCHVGMGMALHGLGRTEEALEPYAAARALYLEFDEQLLLADVDDRRGLALCDLGRFEEAAAAHQAAVTRYEGLGEGWLAARSRRYRSHPLDHAGRVEEALGDLEAARQVLADHDDDVEVARCDAAVGAALLAAAERALTAAELDDEADWCARLLEDPSTLAHRHP